MDVKNINEGYPDGEEPLHFFYNREERIARAPKIVQDYYSGKFNCTKKGLFRTLFATRGNRLMFASMVIFMAFVWIYSLVMNRASIEVAGSTAELSAFSYDENVYVTFKIKERKKSDEREPVSVNVKLDAYDSDSCVCNSYSETVIFDGSEVFVRTKFPDYDIISVAAEVDFESENRHFAVKVQNR